MTILSFTPGTWYRDDISFTPGTSTSGYSINIIWFNSGVARMWLNVLVTCQPQPSAPPPFLEEESKTTFCVRAMCVQSWTLGNTTKPSTILFNKMQIHEIKHISHRTFYMWPSKETNLLGCKCLSEKVLHSADGQQKPRVLSAASSSWYQHHHSLGQKSSNRINSSELQTCVVGQNWQTMKNRHEHFQS